MNVYKDLIKSSLTLLKQVGLIKKRIAFREN